MQVCVGWVGGAMQGKQVTSVLHFVPRVLASTAAFIHFSFC